MALAVARRGHILSFTFSLSLTFSFEFLVQLLWDLHVFALCTFALQFHFSVMITVLMSVLLLGHVSNRVIYVLEIVFLTLIYSISLVFLLYLYSNNSAAFLSYVGCVQWFVGSVVWS